jgi:hypothetical protein
MSKLTNQQLLALIGEVDGIRLIVKGGVCYVYLNILEREIELIRDGSASLLLSGDNFITRSGIADAIEAALSLKAKKRKKK